MAFTTPVDVANRALQIIGVPRVSAIPINGTGGDSSKQAKEAGFAIDKIRASELRRSVWTFATRRSVLRPVVATTVYSLFAAWSSSTTYAAGDIVVDAFNFLWISNFGSNTGNTPGAGGVSPFWTAYFGASVAQVWSGSVSYFPGDMVYVSGTPNVIYIAVALSLNHTPPNATYWHVVQGATSTALVQFSPLGVQPPTGATTRNIYQLPANFVRMAPQDPKIAAVAHQGLTAGMMYNDWELEAGYLFTGDAAPIIFRFVADQPDVTQMNALFCEAWAAQLAIALAPTLTQSAEKLNTALGVYRDTMGVAKAMNAVEEGSTESELAEANAPQPQQGRQQ